MTIVYWCFVTDDAVVGLTPCNNVGQVAVGRGRHNLESKQQVLRCTGPVSRTVGFVHSRFKGRVKEMITSLVIHIGYWNITLLSIIRFIIITIGISLHYFTISRYFLIAVNFHSIARIILNSYCTSIPIILFSVITPSLDRLST